MVYYVYILYSESLQKYYIGQTNDVEARLERHNKGRKKFTSKGVPWRLVFYKVYETRAEAMERERKLKNLKSRKKLEEWILKNKE